MGKFLIPVGQITAAVACDEQLFTCLLVLFQYRHLRSSPGSADGGRQAGGFHAGAIVMFLIDESGVIQEGRKLFGVTCFARVTALPGFEGKHVGGLTEEDLPKHGRNLRRAILDARNSYNKFISGEEIPQPPSPFQRVGRTLTGRT